MFIHHTCIGNIAKHFKVFLLNFPTLLSADEKASPSEVVNQVARIASPAEAFTTRQIHSLLETNDIHR